MRKMNLKIALLGPWLLAVSYFAAGASVITPGVTRAAELGAKAVYQKYCSVCHGDQGNGDTRAAGGLTPKPRNFTTTEAAIELTRDRMIQSVTRGRPGTAMVGHAKKLTATQIAAVVDYIRTSYMELPKETPATLQTPGAAKPALTPAQAIYKKHCATCHGEDGRVASWARTSLNPPPRDFTDTAVHAELTRERMIQSVTGGRTDTAMMPFSSRLSGAQIGTVVDYIRSNFMHADAPAAAMANMANMVKPVDTKPATPVGVPAAAPQVSNTPVAIKAADMKLPMPKKLKGNIQDGQAFFMKNCFTCHGVKGDGDGPRAHFITPRPRNFTSEQSRQTYNRPTLFDAITNGKRGTVMPAWGAVLNEQQIADVAEFVFQGFIKASFKVQVPEHAQVLQDAKKKGY